MSIYKNTVIRCSNPNVLAAFALGIKDCNLEDCLEWNDGDTEIQVTTMNTFPRREIKKLSLRFPDDIITCRFSYELDGYSEAHIVEYRNGEDKEMDIEPEYSYTLIDIDLNHLDDLFKIYNKAGAFFRKLDTTETDKEGNMFINWFNDDVCYKFIYDSADGKIFKVESTKYRTIIHLKVYERFGENYWQKISDSTDVDVNDHLSEAIN